MRWQTTLGLVALAALATWTAWWLSSATTTRELVKPQIGPAWYFNGARFSASDGTGTILYRVRAPSITQDPVDGAAVLVEPELRWTQGDAPPLSITALTARADPGGARMTLTGDVTIIDESELARFEFRAPDLVVDAVRRVAFTESAVVMRGGFGEVTGVGLVADMNAGTIRIESEVRGRYAR